MAVAMETSVVVVVVGVLSVMTMSAEQSEVALPTSFLGPSPSEMTEIDALDIAIHWSSLNFEPYSLSSSRQLFSVTQRFPWMTASTLMLYLSFAPQSIPIINTK